MLIDCDKNTTNGLTNFNALQVSKVDFPRVLQPQIFAVVTLISKDDVGDGKHFNLTFRLSTLNGKLKGYYENENGGPFYFTPMNDDGTFTMNNIPTGKTIGVYGYASYGTRHTPIPQNNILYVDVQDTREYVTVRPFSGVHRVVCVFIHFTAQSFKIGRFLLVFLFRAFEFQKVYIGNGARLGMYARL